MTLKNNIFSKPNANSQVLIDVGMTLFYLCFPGHICLSGVTGRYLLELI